MKSMNDLMLHFLQDIYYAEKLGIRGMAKMAKSVENPELKQAILQHRDQSQTQISRLDQVFEELGKRARGKTCAAMDGLSEEADEAVEEGEKGPVLDSALIACAQAVEHYEIARYGAMVAWAKTLGLTQAAKLLKQTLDEEKESDRLLNDIAERALNQQAAESGEEDEDDGEGKDESPETEEPPPKRRAKPAATKKPAPAKKPAPPPAPAKKPARRAARK